MIRITEAYRAESFDLKGEILLKPLKYYHGFFAKRVENSPFLGRLALRIVNIVTGIFAYPILGALASVGILIKLIEIYDIKKHNDTEKARINKIEIKYHLLVNNEEYAKKWKQETERLLNLSKGEAGDGDEYLHNRKIPGTMQLVEISPEKYRLTAHQYSEEKMKEKIIPIIDRNSEQFKKVYIAIQAIPAFARHSFCKFSIYNRVGLTFTEWLNSKLFSNHTGTCIEHKYTNNVLYVQKSE